MRGEEPKPVEYVTCFEKLLLPYDKKTPTMSFPVSATMISIQVSLLKSPIATDCGLELVALESCTIRFNVGTHFGPKEYEKHEMNC